jgi:predicted ester cyclase
MVGVETDARVAPSGGAALSTEQVEHILSVYLEARNTARLELLDGIYDPAVVVHDCGAPGDLRGLAALKTYYRGSHEGLSDFRMELFDVFAGGDRLAMRWTVSGTHTGELRGLPPTGKAVRFSGVAIDRVVDGRIVEEWVDYNVLSVLQQLGLAPMPPAGAGG